MATVTSKRPGAMQSSGASSRQPGAGVRSTLGVAKPTRRRRKETPVEQGKQYVGIDLHRCRPTDSMSTAAARSLTMADGRAVATRAHRVVAAPQAVGVTPR